MAPKPKATKAKPRSEPKLAIQRREGATGDNWTPVEGLPLPDFNGIEPSDMREALFADRPLLFCDWDVPQRQAVLVALMLARHAARHGTYYEVPHISGTDGGEAHTAMQDWMGGRALPADMLAITAKVGPEGDTKTFLVTINGTVYADRDYVAFSVVSAFKTADQLGWASALYGDIGRSKGIFTFSPRGGLDREDVTLLGGIMFEMIGRAHEAMPTFFHDPRRLH